MKTLSSTVVIRLVAILLAVVALAALWGDKRGWAKALFWVAIIIIFVDLNDWLPKIESAVNALFTSLRGLKNAANSQGNA